VVRHATKLVLADRHTLLCLLSYTTHRQAAQEYDQVRWPEQRQNASLRDREDQQWSKLNVHPHKELLGIFFAPALLNSAFDAAVFFVLASSHFGL
jgi:hypothetical protein